jgi:hypothetical protein
MSYDVHIEGITADTADTDDYRGTAFLTFGNYNGNSTVGVRGVHKLVSRFIKCFMTPKGSDLSDPDYGTSLLSAFLGNVRISFAAQLASQSVQEAFDNLREYDIEYDLDDDERISSVDIQDIYVDELGLGIYIKVYIQSISGEEALFTIQRLTGNNNG